MNARKIDKLIGNYVMFCEFQKGLSQKTLKAYRIDLNQFSCFVHNSDDFYTKEQIQ